MAHSYPEPGKTRYGALLIGVGIALCAFVLGWLFRFWIEPASESDPTTVPAPSASPTEQPTVAGPADDQLSRCQQVFTAQEPPLASGAASMEQWTAHIAAMNQLVAGEISLRQANTYWEQTRVGAQERLQAYADTVSRYDARTVRCPRVAAQEAGSPLATCAEAVADRRRALAALSTALATWRTHVRHMEMLRNGEMSPARAVALWLKSWRQGQAEVRVYRQADRDAQALSC